MVYLRADFGILCASFVDKAATAPSSLDSGLSVQVRLPSPTVGEG